MDAELQAAVQNFAHQIAAAVMEKVEQELILRDPNWVPNTPRHRVGATKAGAPRKRAFPIDWSKVPLLGKVPDTVLAAQLGCHQSQVWKARETRGLPLIRSRGWTPS